MPPITMPPRNLSFVLSEANGGRSRSTGTIPAGTGVVDAGTVLGELTATAGHFVPSPDAEMVGLEGAETATAVLAYGVDATGEDVEAVLIDRDAVLKEPLILFHASVDDAAKTTTKIAQLDAVGLRVR